MIPGSTSKLSEAGVQSAATIHAKTDIVLLLGTTQVNTIRPNFGGGQFSGFLVLIPVNGAVILGTSGNILVGATLVVNRATLMIYSKTIGKWAIQTVV